jgi:structural maintenance of chromosome 1
MEADPSSLELAPAYEAAKLAQEKATEAANANQAKRRAMQTEVNHFKEQTAEVKQWEKLSKNKVGGVKVYHADRQDKTIQKLMLWKLYHITAKINEAAAEVEEATQNLRDLESDVTSSEHGLHDARKEDAEAKLAVKKREMRLRRAEKSVEDKNPELVAVTAQIAHSEKKAENSEVLYGRVQKDQQRQAESLAALEKGAAEINARMEEAKEKHRQRSRAQGKALSDGDLAEYRKLRADANLVGAQKRQQLDALRREQKSLRDTIASFDDRLLQAERRRTKLDSEISDLQDREESVSTRVKSLEKERKRIKSEIDHIAAERVSISTRETQINDNLADVMSKLIEAGAHKSQSDRQQRFIETLAKLRSMYPGVHGRVVDLCKPTANKYDTAVMTILGRNIDAVVVDHQTTAIECIEYLRQHRAGQATFLPLDTIQTKNAPEKLRTIAKGARLAIDCIEFDPSVERAMQHACGSALICDTAAIAKNICYDKRQDVKAVTLDGTVFHKMGLITGGRGSSERKFNDRDVDTLNMQKGKLLAQLDELRKSRPRSDADEQLVQDLARVEAELSTASDDLNATRLRLKGLGQERDNIKKDIDKFNPEKQKRATTLADVTNKYNTASAAVAQADDQVFAAFCQRIGVPNIREYEDVQLKAAEEENEALEQFKAQVARATHQIDFEKAQLASTEERLTHLKATVDKEKRNRKTLTANKDAIENELAELQDEVARQREKVQQCTEALKDTSAAVETARDLARKHQRALDRALKEISASNDSIDRFDSDRHALYRKCRLEDVDLPLLSGSLADVELEEDESMEVDDFRPVKTKDSGIEPDFSLLDKSEKDDSSDSVSQGFEAQISKMKAELERVVPNMKAVNRLSEVQKDLEGVAEEGEEVRKESKRARDDFNDLRKRRCDLFNKAYQHMSQRIDKIYKELTKNALVSTGGMAFLSLEDAEEPYLGGVKYNTMPPGKRFADIDQLSGGEKTMAALALLFAIHSYHPAPFFVLDEVDAALDATNVARLARFVRDQSSKVQFLIISLKPTLYEHADSLVGVYREQVENSSRTLTMDLAKYE